MPKGQEKVVIFLTEGNKSPILWEHQFKLGGKWTNWCTCCKPLGVQCALCKWADTHNGSFNRYKGAFFTIIDTTEFEAKDGTKKKNLKKLLVAKKDTVDILKRKWQTRVEAGEGMRGAMFKIYRPNSDKSCSVGEDFEFVKMVDMAAISDSAEFNYAEMLKPDPEKAQTLFEALHSEHGTGGKPAPAAAPEGTEGAVKY